MADKKPTFSAGLITAIVTAVFLIVFAYAVHHGQEGIQHSQQVATPAK